MSASTLVTNSIASTMNSDEASRQLDAKAGLENYVRLSFCEKNPMLYVSLNEGRISKPVMLQVRLEALAKNGVQRGLTLLSVKTLRSCDLTWSKPKPNMMWSNLSANSTRLKCWSLPRSLYFQIGLDFRRGRASKLNQQHRPPPTKPMSLF